MSQIWPRGSEWRKWDLHLHSPGTKLNDQFLAIETDPWDEYCRILHESDVQAFGIADYFSVEGYVRTVREFRKRYSDSKKVFFPNIELRTGDVVNLAQEEVNVHLIFNSFHTDHIERIKTFLQQLKTNKTEGGTGRHVRASELVAKRHFEEATTTRQFIRDALAETYGGETDLLDCILIITAANNDGIRAERGKKRKLLITDELDKFSNGFFGSSVNVDYFLSNHRAEDKSVDTDSKPVLSGCDAHSLDELEARLGKTVSNSDGIVFEPTWIKADLTFEGLKQIIFEPQNRVYIGNEPEIKTRIREHKTKYIDAVHITNTDTYDGQHGAWFSDEHILLGSELVAIIGNKGSGKSAVADIIGLLGNSHNQTSDNAKRGKEELFSFLNEEKFLKRKIASNFTGRLIWLEGEPDFRPLDAKTDKNLPEKVEFLPQKYLERICANITDDEFRVTLNEVIFGHVEPQNRHGKRNLDDLISYLTRQAEEELKESRHALHLANQRVVSIEKKLTIEHRKHIEGKINLKKEELKAHESERPVEHPKPADLGEDLLSSDQSRLESLSEEIADCSSEIEQLESERIATSDFAEKLRQARQAIERESRRLTGLESQFGQDLEAAGLSFDKIVQLAIDFVALDGQIDQKTRRLKEIEELISTEEKIRERFSGTTDAESVIEAAIAESIVCRKSALQSEMNEIVNRLAEPERKYQTYLTELENWTTQDRILRGDEENPSPDSLAALEAELHSIGNIYPDELQKAKTERLGISREVFQKKVNLSQFYNAIKQSIDEEIKKCRHDLGDYSMAIDAGLRFDPVFYDTFLGFVNQSRRGSFHGAEEGRAMLRGICEAVGDWEEEGEVFEALNEIMDALSVDRRDESQSLGDSRRELFKQLKSHAEPVDLYDYLFGFEYLNTKYDLIVDQKDLSELSPGERGGLLLIFYLMLDRQDIPLIIDQPEDNLDNKSVYEILVKFIKQAKRRRQIILVTHNPNLAVVADAEQIIHVSLDKKDGRHEFDFFSGALEDSRINQVVVDILEGTRPAFDNRRLKYRKAN